MKKVDESTKIKYVGKVFSTNFCGDLVVLEYHRHNHVVVKFLETGYITTVSMGNLRKGNCRDKLLPMVFGVGIVGDEITRTSTGTHTKEYALWVNMLSRCYNVKVKNKSQKYSTCKVSENFKYFPYFKEWCNKQIGFGKEGWQLDKDILIKGNVLYSEHTCTFIPQEINKLFTMRESKRGDYPLGVHKVVSVKEQYQAQFWKDSKLQYLGQFDTPEQSFLAYKQQKELRVKEVANKWKEQIDVRVYEALMNWVVEISD